MRTAIIYHSRYGSTKQYAEWIHEQVDGTITSVKDAGRIDLRSFDLVVFGGFFHSGKISIRKLIVNNWSKVEDKHTILFTTSGTPPTSLDIQVGFQASFPEDIQDQMAFFPLRGRIDTSKWNLTDRMLTHVGSFVQQDPDIKKGMVTDFDGVKFENILPITDYIEELRINESNIK